MVTMLVEVSLHTGQYQSSVMVTHLVREIKTSDRHTERRVCGLPTIKIYDSN